VGPRHKQRPGGVVPLEAGQVGESYEVRLEGQGRVAGRSATYLSLKPRDRYRYGYRVALDDATALPLRTELVDERGVPLVQTLFVDLRVGPEVPAVAETAVPAADAERNAVAKAAAPVRETRPPWSFTDLPPGFRLAMATRRTLPGDGRELQHLVLTDGLASVSVYIATPGGHDLDGEAAVGPVNAFGARVGGFQATALGEVPPATLKALVGALRAQPGVGG
jgi:sigma-E factor negative regulatory protein RseB